MVPERKQYNNLHVRNVAVGFSQASYNYNIESDVNGQTANNVYYVCDQATAHKQSRLSYDARVPLYDVMDDEP